MTTALETGSIPKHEHHVTVSDEVAALIVELQSVGLRVDTPTEKRVGGAGPSDSGYLWVEGIAITMPTETDDAHRSPYVLKPEDGGTEGIYRDGVRLASASRTRRPKFYDMSTADGVPYWKIALMHMDSLASTVVQTCSYWGNSDQCTFCGIGLSLDAGRTIVKKSPEQLAEVAVAAKELDGAVDCTLTTGSSNAPDRGALYVAKCGHAVKEASGLPVEVQFEPPRKLEALETVRDLGIDSVGIHVESMDPKVLERVAPGKFRTGIDYYFKTWERAVELFGFGRVSTYVILGMGEDPQLTIQGCRRAVDIGVYPFIVPLRPVAGSLMADVKPPSPAYMNKIYNAVVPYMNAHGMTSDVAVAGCARCQACSAMDVLSKLPSSMSPAGTPVHKIELPVHSIGSRPPELAR